MATTGGSGRKGPVWKSDWFFGLAVVLLMLALHWSFDLFGGVERAVYDSASSSSSRQPSGDIAIIAIDDESIANIGRWPWPRDVHAQLIDQLAQAKARAIGHTALFIDPQTDRGLTFIQKLRETIAPLADPAAATADQAALVQQLLPALDEAIGTLDTDAALGQSIKAAGNVVLPGLFTLGEPQGRPDADLPDYVQRSMVDDPTEFSLLALQAQMPIPVLGQQAAEIAHLNQIQDVDGALRQEPLLVNYFGQALPSFSLMVAARSLNLGAADIKLQPDRSGIQLGRLSIPTDAYARVMPQFYADRGGRPPFAIDSFYDVITGKIPATKYAGKIVLIGATAAGVGGHFATPVSPSMSPVETMAHITSSLLSGHFIAQPAWGGAAALGALLLVAAYLMAGLPRLSAGRAAAATGVLFVVLLGAEFALLSSAALWIQLTLPAALLLLGHLALTTKRFLVTEAGKVKSDEESAETNRMMGLALQGQGQLDMAFDRFTRVPLSEAVMDNLLSLAMDFERKRQFNKAEAVYKHMAAFNPDFKDLKTRMNRAKNLSETVILGGGGGHPGGTLVLDSGAVEKPMLGRYQVEKELGKGAMGVVYQGRDPKIGRVVAIKTMALSQEFEGDELQDARERFFREAETAGRLQHQNIVTIFDAGEEHDLAYIAMEFLKGRDLTDHARVDRLLPVPRVLSIVARVAEALSYAHQQNVVHRDIKPANIMYEPDSDVVKVTDFGIARVTDSSKTKTGMVLGTPSFMSPEQLSGKKIDGRSDLYSLGVTLFQMLTGMLPFRGDSMAELMYKIANEPAPDVRELRSDLPDAVAQVLARALAKNADERYQDGAALAQALRAAAAESLLEPAAANHQAPPDFEKTQPMSAEKLAELQQTHAQQLSDDDLKTQPMSADKLAELQAQHAATRAGRAGEGA